VLIVNPNFLEGGDIEKYLLAVSCRQKFSASGYTATSAQDSPEVGTFTAWFLCMCVCARALSKGIFHVTTMEICIEITYSVLNCYTI
jgi:hypothetical protein